MSKINFATLSFVIISIGLLSGCVVKTALGIPEEKRYLVKVIIAADITLSYKCDNLLYKHDGYAMNCEDNEGRQISYLNFRANVTEIVDRHEELK